MGPSLERFKAYLPMGRIVLKVITNINLTYNQRSQYPGLCPKLVRDTTTPQERRFPYQNIRENVVRRSLASDNNRGTNCFMSYLESKTYR